MPWIKVKPVVDTQMRALCVKPYPLHKHGCPNFDKKAGCPPAAPIFNHSGDIYAIYNIFPYKQHIESMRQRHPNWSDRQVKCVLYWQGTARKQLRYEIRSFLDTVDDFYIIGCPEAQGVNLTKTMSNVGIELEWPPVNIAYQIVLAVKRESHPHNRDH
jgi:predicted metal-binding protein